MKIISSDEYCHMKVKEQCLVDAIDRALMLLGNIDKGAFSCDKIDAEGNYYFWSAIGTLKGALYENECKHKDEWIEP